AMNFESESCHGWTQSYAMLHLCKGLHVSQSESTLSPSGSSSCSSTPPRSNSKPLPVLRDYGSVRHTELWKWLWLDFSRPVSSEVPRLIRKNMQQCSRSHLDLEALEPICETAVGLSQSNSSLFKEGSQSAAVFTLVSSAMGAGCLSLPFMLKTAGIIPGLLMLFLGAVLAHLSLVVLMSCSRYTESDSFSKLVALTGTKRTARTGGASRSVDVVIAVYGIAAVLCYLMFIGDFFLGIVQSPLLQLNLSRETLIVIISVLVVWPLSLPRDLSALRHVCVLSVLAICLTAVAVALKAPSYAHIGSLQAPEADWQLVWWKSDPYAMLQSFSIALFSFAAHTNAVPVATSLKAADGASIWRAACIREQRSLGGASGTAPPGVAPNPNLCNGAVGAPGVAPNPNLWNGAVGTSGPAVPTVPTVPAADINPWSGYSLARQDQMDVASPYMPRRSYPADPHLRLRRAVCHNDRATVLEALRCGGGLGRDKSGKTAMHYAANRGNYELLYILMDHGLDPNVACYNGYTVVDEAEYWEPARLMRRRCRDLLAAYGGRRSYNSETVMNDRLRLENKNFGIQPPWRDDLEKVGRESQWMKQEPKIDGWTPPIADASDLPDPELSDEGRPTVPWDPAPAVPSAPRPIPAPAARAVPTLPPEPAVATADSTWGDSVLPPLKPLREILLGRSYATREEFTDCTNEVRDLILDLQKHPRNLYIKMRPVPPFDPNGRSYEV
ncbi:unnamed protein product, partial [Cladocopium goreaui]